MSFKTQNRKCAASGKESGSPKNERLCDLSAEVLSLPKEATITEIIEAYARCAARSLKESMPLSAKEGKHDDQVASEQRSVMLLSEWIKYPKFFSEMHEFVKTLIRIALTPARSMTAEEQAESDLIAGWCNEALSAIAPKVRICKRLGTVLFDTFDQTEGADGVDKYARHFRALVVYSLAASLSQGSGIFARCPRCGKDFVKVYPRHKACSTACRVALSRRKGHWKTSSVDVDR